MFWTVVIAVVAVVLLAVWLRDQRAKRRAVDAGEARTRLRVSRENVDHFTRRHDGGPFQ